MPVQPLLWRRRSEGRLRASVVAVLLLAVVCASLAPASAQGAKQTVTLGFTELPTQPVNGVSLNGLTFGFTNGDATYNAFGPGSTAFVEDPSLEGSTFGTLTLRFARPTNTLEFGLALSTFGTLTPGATVALYNPGGHLRRLVPITTQSLVSFTEARFVYSGGAIGSAVITFNSSAGRFALDNLTFEQKGVPRRQAFAPSVARTASWQR